MVWSKLLRKYVLLLFAMTTFCGVGLPVASVGAEKAAVDLRQHPTGGKTPVEVSVGLYLTNLVAIDESRETVEVTGYLFGKWRDPRLEGHSADGSRRSFKVEELWTPAIEGENSVSHKMSSYSLEADSKGWVTYTEQFDGVLSTAYSLEAFPFDTQVLRFEYQPFLAANSEFRFAAQALSTSGISRGKYTQLAAWQVKELGYSREEAKDSPQGGETERAVFSVVVTRRWGFYLWKVFIPLLIMALIPMVVFWIDVKEFDWLLKIPMTMLLSTVAFEFVVARDLPKIGYVTLLDAVFLTSLIFYSICIAEIATVFLLQRGGRRPLAERVHKAGRWAYPAAYFSALILLAVCFLG
jgi:Neurotransmitter-gated ion-channel ligand binding domain